MIVSACGFDCYDACRIISKEDKLIGDKFHPFGNGALCSIVNQKLLNEPRITKPMIDGKEVSWDELYHKLVTVLDDKSLLWRGSGNFGVMNQITNLLMQKVGGYTTKGTLCDGAGEAGVMEGRGVNHTLSISQIAKSEVLVVWGRNISVTNSHLMPYLEGKTIIVIDPIKTPIAKQATLHIQLKPRMDYYLAIMLSRFAFMDGCVDESWCEEFASEYEEFYEYTREHRIKAILEEMDVDLSIMGRFIDMIRDKKVVFLVGNGVQKYSIGSYVLHAIDSLAASLGLFGKEGCGVSYIGNSTAGFDNPFDVKTKQVSKVNTPFDEFDTVLIQGGNPAESMPNSNSVKAKLKKVKNLIYFGLYENETSRLANIIIPAKNFLEKDDLRLSYVHSYVEPMRKIQDCDIGVSEYDLVAKLYELKGFDGLKTAQEYIDIWINQCHKDKDILISPAYQEIPYQDGFGNDGDDEFVFIDEFDDDFIDTKRFRKIRKKKDSNDDSFWLITPKSSKSLNTQFANDNKVYLHPDLGYEDNQLITIKSDYGVVELVVQNSKDVRKDCLLIPISTKGVNNLTPDIISEYGDSACYQEVKVKIV
jgi:anaerobic selenocysteine-containing dehydrogenase